MLSETVFFNLLACDGRKNTVTLPLPLVSFLGLRCKEKCLRKQCLYVEETMLFLMLEKTMFIYD